jgi:effector-binding domain-containing protein
MNTNKPQPGKTQEKNQPEKKFRAGPICATIWSNNNLDKDGKVVAYRSVSFERSYKDKNDSWQTTHSLRLNDLPKAALVLQKAYEYLALTTMGEAEA